MLKHIYLDLDGVCNCLIMHALEYVGCPVSRYFDNGYPLKGDYDISRAASILLKTTVTREQFWASIPRAIWSQTPPSTVFPFLLATTFELVGNNVSFLTKPTDPESAAGKLEWIRRYAPANFQYSITNAKHLASCPGTLLIDDSDDEVMNFTHRPDGLPSGDAILVPRPWNSKHEVTDTIPYLTEQLKKFKQSGPTSLQTKYSHLRLIPQPEEPTPVDSPTKAPDSPPAPSVPVPA